LHLFLHSLTHSLEHSLIDTLKMLPILYISYLLMEFLEHRAGTKMDTAIAKVHQAGPLLGSLLGLIPQCGFSGAVSGLYAGGVATLGTLIAVFLSTSDEMLPLMISSGAPATLIVRILAAKFLCGLAAGFLIDGLVRRRPKEIHELCERDHCSCERHNIWIASAIHCLQVGAIIFTVMLVLELLFEVGGEAVLSTILLDIPVVGELVAALIGLIPSCSSSVLLTQLYLEGGIIGIGPLMAGLFANAGVGLLVLFRLNKNKKENLSILLLTYFISVICGLLTDLIL